MNMDDKITQSLPDALEAKANDSENSVSTSQTILSPSLIREQMSENIYSCLKRGCFDKKGELETEESGSKRSFEEANPSASIKDNGLALGTSRDVESPAAKKSKLNKLKIRFPSHVNEKKEVKSVSGKGNEAMSLASSNKVVRPYKSTVKKAKKVTASKYIRKPKLTVDSDDGEMRLDFNRNENMNNTSDNNRNITIDGLVPVHASSAVSCSLDVSNAIGEISTGGPPRILKTVTAADLTVYLVMAVVSMHEFSDEDVCKWIISSKRTKYTGFNGKFGIQFDAYRVLYNIVRINSDNENGKELIGIIKKSHYKTPKKLNGWFLVFDEIPAMLENVSLSASVQEQSNILKYFRHSDSSVPKQIKSEFSTASDYGSHTSSEVQKEIKNSVLRKFLDRLEIILELNVVSDVSIEERMENAIKQLEYEKYSGRVSGRHQILKVDANEDSEFSKRTGSLKIELSSTQEKLYLPSESVRKTENRETKVTELELLNSKIQLLETLNHYYEDQLQSQKIVRDILNRKLFLVEMRYFTALRNELITPSQSSYTAEFGTVSLPLNNEFSKTTPPNSIYKQAEPGRIKLNKCNIKRGQNVNSSFEEEMQNCSKTQHTRVYVPKADDFEIEISHEQREQLDPEAPIIDSEKSIQRNFIQKDHVVIEIPCCESPSSSVGKRMCEIRQEIVKAVLHTPSKNESNRQWSSRVVFKNLVDMLIEYEMLLDNETSCGTGSEAICAARKLENSCVRRVTEVYKNSAENRIMNSNSAQKDETILESVGTSTMAPVYSCISSELHSSIDSVLEADVSPTQLNHEYPQKKEPQVCERKLKRDLQQPLKMHNAHLSVKTYEQTNVTTCERGSFGIESKMSRSDDHSLTQLESATSDNEERCTTIFGHETSVCSKLDSLYTELYFSIDEDPSLIHPTKFISIDGMYEKMQAFSPLFLEVVCIRREKNEIRNNTHCSDYSYSVLLSSMQCLTEEVLDLFHIFNEFCDQEVLRKSSVITLLDKCNHLSSTVSMAKEKIERLQGQFSWLKSVRRNELSAGSTYSCENHKTAENADVIGITTIQERYIAMEAKLRGVEEELKKEQYNRKIIENRLRQALNEINQLVVVWDLLELRNDRSSYVYDRTRSSVSSHDMRLLEQITGLSPVKIQTQSFNSVNVDENSSQEAGIAQARRES